MFYRDMFRTYICHESCIVETCLKWLTIKAILQPLSDKYICINTAIKSPVELNNLIVFETSSLKNEQ